MKIAFVYMGPIKYRGRMFKQIKTLQDNGHECIMIHGRTEEMEPNYSYYSFSVIPIRVIHEKNKLLTIGTQLWFNRKAAGKILHSGADAVVCIALQSALSGALAKKKNSKLRYVFDSNELSLEMMRESFKSCFWAKIQKFILRYPDIIMHAEQHRLDYFNRTYPNAAKSFLLENLPYYQPEIKREEHIGLKAVYLGVLTPDRYCTQMLEAFAKTGNNNIFFDLVGYYVRKGYEKEIKNCMRQLKSENIKVLPPVLHSEIYRFLAGYDVGLAFYKRTNLNNYFCAPNKVYDYIQLGMPVISNDYPGLRDILANNKIGICLPEVNPETIRWSIHEIFRKNLAKNITSDIRLRYSWEHQAADYLKLFE